MAFLEQTFKAGQFLRLDGSHFNGRLGLAPQLDAAVCFGGVFIPAHHSAKAEVV